MIETLAMTMQQKPQQCNKNIKTSTMFYFYLRNMLKTLWELDGNILGTTKTATTPTLPQKKENLGP